MNHDEMAPNRIRVMIYWFVGMLWTGTRRSSLERPGTLAEGSTYKIAVLEPQKLLCTHVLIRRLIVGQNAFAVRRGLVDSSTGQLGSVSSSTQGTE